MKSYPIMLLVALNNMSYHRKAYFCAVSSEECVLNDSFTAIQVRAGTNNFHPIGFSM
jgi:hypothetical protein